MWHDITEKMSMDEISKKWIEIKKKLTKDEALFIQKCCQSEVLRKLYKQSNM